KFKLSITESLTERDFFNRVTAGTISFSLLCFFCVINKIQDRNGLFNSSFQRALKITLNDLKGK
ncbi:MAG: hypothetical protein IJ254_03465, partial [Succinivibrio sp.]|nr:hypothetical protein [Succinivibrio sp.]